MPKKQREEWVEEELGRTRTAKKKRGSANNKSRLDSFAKSDGDQGADWGTCPPEKLLAVVVLMTHLGGALTLGLSRDGGAHMLTLLLDDNRRTLWFNGDADLGEEMDAVIETLRGLA